MATSAPAACAALSALVAREALGTFPSVSALTSAPVSEPSRTLEPVTELGASFRWLTAPFRIDLVATEFFGATL